MEELEPIAPTEILDQTISDQVNLLFYLQDINFPDLYDNWQEDKIKLVTNCMKIIEAQQKKILKEVKG